MTGLFAVRLQAGSWDQPMLSSAVPPGISIFTLLYMWSEKGPVASPGSGPGGRPGKTRLRGHCQAVPPVGLSAFGGVGVSACLRSPPASLNQCISCRAMALSRWGRAALASAPSYPFALISARKSAKRAWRSPSSAASISERRWITQPRMSPRIDTYSAGTLSTAFLRWSKRPQTPSSPCQSPFVAPLEYSVARCSKKLACSTPLRISDSQGSGCLVRP
jgi:hypothetical protein